MNSQIKIGIVGGGQLGKMLTIAAKKMGFYVVVTDPTPESPAGQVADKQIIGGYKDEKTTRNLVKECDVITVDAEFVNEKVLEELEKEGQKIHPTPSTIGIIKDKLKQKQFLKKHKIPTAEFVKVGPWSRSDLLKIGERFGYPFLLKARFDAYDGKGNFVVRNKKDIEKGLEKLIGRDLYIENNVSFIKEIAVIVVRSLKGDIKIYPVVETIHKNNICDVVLAPADISNEARKRARNLSKKVMQHTKGAGVFSIEMFLLKNDKVLVNEIAPRVHNSGHYTIEGTSTSQFEQHIRAITGLPLGSVDMLYQAVVMKNILGEKNGDGFPQGLEKALAIDGVYVHIYGKRQSRPQRKMGHITVVGKSISECLKKANKARRLMII